MNSSRTTGLLPRLRHAAARGAVLLALTASALAQTEDTTTGPASQPIESQPTSQPASAPVNVLRSQASTFAYLTESLERGDEGRRDALICLDPANVDPEKWKTDRFDYLDKLVAILERLQDEKLLDPASLSDDPTAASAAIGRDPILLLLSRQQVDADAAAGTDGRMVWRFSAQTVADIPRLHEKLDELIAAATMDATPTEPPPTEATAAVDPLRSPFHMVQHFVIHAQGAANDPANYVEAMRCLDFSLVDEALVERDGPKYVDQLWALLRFLREKGKFDRNELPEEPAPDVEQFAFNDAEANVSVVIVRRGEQWRFASSTVDQVPEMAAAIETLSERPPPAAALPLDTSTPAGTLNLFFTAMAQHDLRTAVTCLNLADLADRDSSVTWPIAGKIKLALDRDKLIVASEVATPPNDAPVVLIKEIHGRVELVKQTEGKRKGEWLFSAVTVRQIDALYEAWESKPVVPELRGQRLSFWSLPALYVREYVIPQSLKPRWGGLQYWQWLGLALALLLGVLLRRIASAVMPPIVRRALSTRDAAILPVTVRKGLRPTFTFVMLATWWIGLQVLDLGTTVTARASWTLRILLTIGAVHAAYRMIDLLAAHAAARAAKTSSRLDDVLVPLLQKTLKVVVVVIGAIIVAKAFGFQVGPLLAGLGVGGLAFGLAAQDTLKNFFGSVNVVLDRPFQVGDWVRIGQTEGTVEAVGLRSSRIRTFYNSQITVPNSDLMTAAIDNMGRRRFRRISTKLGVLYSTTPEQLEAFCEGIREFIRTHPYTRKDYFHVYVNEFGASAINILLYCFHECPDWGTELRERQRLLLDIMRLAQKLGVEFAFPTQTVHLHHESTPGSAPPESPAIPHDPAAASDYGKDEANKLVRELLGDDQEPPPPVVC